MARKKKHPEHVNHERWLISYADFITLLFAFFTVLYAVSSADSDKLKKLVQSMRTAFGGPAEAQPVSVMPEAGKSPFTPESVSMGLGTPLGFNIAVTDEEIIKSVQLRIENFLVKSVSEGKVRVLVSDRGLVIRIAEAGLFKAGETDIDPKAYSLLDEVALSLVELPNYVRVEGHTDNVPVRSPAYPSNWELSTSRSSRIVRYFIDRHHFPPDRLGAAGFGEYRPAATNQSEYGRAANRRVEIVILRNKLAMTEP